MPINTPSTSNTINVTLLNEGTKYSTMHVYMESDGTGELVDYPFFDPKTDFQIPIPQQIDESTGQLRVPEYTIRKVWHSAAWFDVILGWDSVTPSRVIVLARDTDFEQDFTSFGGIKDRTPMQNLPTGRLTMTTRDFAATGAAGYFVLEIRKD